MSYRSLICCLTISIIMAACDEDEQVIPDRLVRIPGPSGKTVRQNDLDCCHRGVKCDVSRRESWHDKSSGEACSDVALAYSAADDKAKVMEYRLKACDLGQADSGLVDIYNKVYGYESHRSENDPVSDSQKEAEGKMISCCQRSLDKYTGDAKEFCDYMAISFQLAKREPPRRLVLKQLCNKEFVWSACRELKEFNGKPFTEEMYRERLDAKREGERMVAEANASARSANAEQNNYAEQVEQEQVAPVEEEPAPEPIESSPSWGDAAVQAINATRGQDPVQSELNRQLARINAAGRQPPPVRMHTSAPERTGSFRPAPVAVPVPSRTPEPIAVAPFIPAANTETRNNSGSGVTRIPPSATIEPTTGEAQARTKSSRYVYEPGAQFDGCIGFFYDPTFHNWYSIQNSCSVDIRWVMVGPNGSGVVNSGGTSSLGESRNEVAQHPNRQFAFCRKGFIAVNAQDRYWEGGQYRCMASK